MKKDWIWGYTDIGFDRKYETMVFNAISAKDKDSEGQLCCPYRTESGDNLDFASYNDPVDAYRGHLEMCKKWDEDF
jgi:hypothetical protein